MQSRTPSRAHVLERARPFEDHKDLDARGECRRGTEEQATASLTTELLASCGMAFSFKATTAPPQDRSQ
jgi:hypothetical protein